MIKYYKSLGEAIEKSESEGVTTTVVTRHDPEIPGIDKNTPAAAPKLLKESVPGSEPVFSESGEIVGYIKQGAQDVAKFAQNVAPEAQSIAQKFASLSTPGKVMVGLIAYAGLKKIL